ncbi:MAG: CRISPR-associated protein Csx3 [Nanopusillaceae archaeon]
MSTTYELKWLKVEVVDENTAVIKFELTPDTNIAPEELAIAVRQVHNAFQNLRVKKIRITGRGPIWLYSAVTHAVAHMAPIVQVFDAINKRWITVTSHTPEFKIGQVEE